MTCQWHQESSNTFGLYGLTLMPVKHRELGQEAVSPAMATRPAHRLAVSAHLVRDATLSCACVEVGRVRELMPGLRGRAGCAHGGGDSKLRRRAPCPAAPKAYRRAREPPSITVRARSSTRYDLPVPGKRPGCSACPWAPSWATASAPSFNVSAILARLGRSAARPWRRSRRARAGLDPGLWPRFPAHTTIARTSSSSRV